MIDASFLAFDDNVTLQFDRVIAAAPMDVWAALTEPAELAKWLGPLRRRGRRRRWRGAPRVAREWRDAWNGPGVQRAIAARIHLG